VRRRWKQGWGLLEKDYLAIYDKHGPRFRDYLEMARTSNDRRLCGAGSLGWQAALGVEQEDAGVWHHDFWPNPGHYQWELFIPNEFLECVGKASWQIVEDESA